jgi:hypothetical protein
MTQFETWRGDIFANVEVMSYLENFGEEPRADLFLVEVIEAVEGRHRMLQRLT